MGFSIKGNPIIGQDRDLIAYSEKIQNVTAEGSVTELDLSLSNVFHVVVTTNTDIQFINVPQNDTLIPVVVIVEQDATGGREVDFLNIDWINEVNFSGSSGSVEIANFLVNGNSFYGFAWSDSDIDSEPSLSGTFTGDGTTFSFDIGAQPSDLERLIWVEGGIVQEPVTDYTIDGTNVIRAEAPANGVDISWRIIGGAIGPKGEKGDPGDVNNHTHDISDVNNLQTELDGKQSTSEKGAANGYASLDEDGLVPEGQLPEVAGVESEYQEFLTSGTWTKPEGVIWVYVEAIGGGGSGAARDESRDGTGGGGGGGFTARLLRASELPSEVTVTVGSGGPPVFADSGFPGKAGANGGDSLFGIQVTAKGGSGGGGMGSGIDLTRRGGTAGGGETGAERGDYPTQGGYSSGAGGSGAISVEEFANGANCVMGGAGGGGAKGNGGMSTMGGDGGDGAYSGISSTTAEDGDVPGGGGGGAGTDGEGTTATSGAGGDGRVRVWAW